jgi:dihydroorotate dehydrogenase
MSKNQTIPFVDHEYSLTAGDRMLSLIRTLVRSPEMRHHSLTPLSRIAPFLGHKASQDPDLKHTIYFQDRSIPIIMGNPFILAAGSNKTAEWIPECANLGFGGVTVGTATRNLREGNLHRPRVGMIELDRAIHNSMGLNNPGIDVIAKRVDAQMGQAHKKGLSVGISVAETPGLEDEEQKLEDMVETFRIAYKVADYVEINISCPNTGEARLDLDTRFMERMFSQVMKVRKQLAVRKAVYAKLSPDLTESQLTSVLAALRDLEVNGLVLFNTFPSDRSKYLTMQTPLNSLPVLTSSGARGGLSGRILYRNTFRAVEYIKNQYPDFSIMACGGIDHGAKAWDLLKLGVDAVQAYTVVAYRWFALEQMRRELLQAMRQDGYAALNKFTEGRPTGSQRRI